MKELKAFAEFINERHMIHERRRSGMLPPWTRDPILQKYRFCNVRREDDRVTKWIHSHWLQPYRHDKNVWFAAVVARFVNWPDTLESIGYPNNWNANRARWFVEAVEQRQVMGKKAFTSAYMIRAIEADSVGGGKARYLAQLVFTPLWEARDKTPRRCKLREFHEWLLPFYGMGSFLAAQVVADVKHTDVLNTATDWHTFAAPGPGSIRGMSRVEFGDLSTAYTDASWREAMAELRKRVMVRLVRPLRDLDAQNIQNCLCEFDKYMRAKNGEGRPRQNFNPSQEEYV